jgi:hypothetical protein
LPQFNWPVLGPIILAILGTTAGIALFFSRVQHHTPPSAANSTGVHRADSAAVKLQGYVVGTPHLRAGPSSNATVLQDLQSGQIVDVSACSSSCGWFFVGPLGQTSIGWVPAAFVTVHGDERRLTVIKQ